MLLANRRDYFREHKLAVVKQHWEPSTIYSPLLHDVEIDLRSLKYALNMVYGCNLRF